MQLNEERAALERRRRDREEQHLYLPVGVVTEDNFKTHQGFDLTTWDSDVTLESGPKTYRVLRASTVADFAKTLADENNVPPEQVRFWVLVNRQNKTVRPDQPLSDPAMTIDEAHNKYGSRDKHFRLWLEIAGSMENGKPVWPDTQIQTSSLPILVFLKHFDADSQTLKGVGHIYIRKHSKVSDMVPMILQLMGWSHSQSASSGLASLSGSTLVQGQPASSEKNAASNSTTIPALALYEVSS